MTNPDVTAAARQLHELGLNPFHPSAETLEVSKRPEMPSPLLTDLDRIGIHQQLILDEIHIRFWHQLHPWPDPTRKGVHASATVLALRSAGLLLRKRHLAAEYKDWGQRLHEWAEGRLADADARLDAWLDTHDIAFEEEYEPASTLIHAVAARKWVDIAQDTRRFKRGFITFEERGATKAMRKELRKDLNERSYQDLDVLRTLHFFGKVVPGKSISKVTHDHRIEFDPALVCEAFQSATGRLESVYHPWTDATQDPVSVVDEHPALGWTPGWTVRQLTSIARPLVPRSSGLDSDIVAFSKLRAFRRGLEEERARLGRKSARAVVIDHFEDLALHKVTQWGLARRTGVDRAKIGKAWKAVRDQLERFLSA